jgi:hypothetical protein
MDDKKSHITISGKQIPCRYEKLDIYKLEYYEENPRIGSIIAKNKGSVDQKFIGEKLWDRDETHKLMGRIKEDGGLIHAILVFDNKVIEGNTRLCAFRHLHELTKDDKWATIPCQILETEIDKRGLYRLLCNEHIVGKIEWDTYEKGSLLTRMLEEDHMKEEEISEISKLSVGKVKEHIAAYKLMVRENDNNPKRFSHYVQLVVNAEVRKISKEKDPTVIKKIVGAIKNDQFCDAKNLRHVQDIYHDKVSRRRFFEEGESFSDVFDDLKANKLSVGSTFIRATDDLTERMKKLTRAEREEVQKSQDGRLKVQKLFKELINFCIELGIEIHVPNKLRK